MTERMTIRPVSTFVGAEILDVDLADSLPEPTVDAIRRALFQNGVVFFRDQKLTPEQHVAFAQRFGEININRFFKAVDGHPMIAEVRKEPEQKGNIGGGWHTDHSYDQAPAMGSILYAREVPETGGDTLFASMYAAYDALGDLKGRYLNPEAAQQDAVHPVVVRHPGSGRKALYVNAAFTVRIDGWTDEESQPFLRYLYQHAARPEFSYRFQWREGSIAFWDNRCTWHYALNDYHGQRRLMHRITVEGVPLS